MTRGRKPFNPNAVDPKDGINLADKAIGARTAHVSLEDIASVVYRVNVATIYRHIRDCAAKNKNCHFCEGMRSAQGAGRVLVLGNIQKAASDKTSPYWWKANVLLATHAPSSPLRAKVEVSGSADAPPIAVTEFKPSKKFMTKMLGHIADATKGHRKK